MVVLLRNFRLLKRASALVEPLVKRGSDRDEGTVHQAPGQVPLVRDAGCRYEAGEGHLLPHSEPQVRLAAQLSTGAYPLVGDP